MFKIWDPGPDRGYSWVILISSCVIRFCCPLNTRVASVLIPEVMLLYNVDRGTATLPFFIRIASISLSGMVIAIFYHRFTFRQQAFVFVFMQVFGYIICFLGSYNIVWLCLGVGVLSGMGAGSISFSTNLILTDYFSEHFRLANSISTSSTLLCSVLEAPLMLFLLDRYEVRGSFLCLSCWLAQAFIASALMRDRTEKYFVFNQPFLEIDSIVAQPQSNEGDEFNEKSDSILKKTTESQVHSNSGDSKLNSSPSKKLSLRAMARIALKKPAFYVICTAHVLLKIVFGTINIIFFDVLVENGIQPWFAASMISTCFFTALVSRIPLSWLQGKKYFTSGIAYSVSLFLYGTALLVLGFKPSNKPLVSIVTITLGVSQGIFSPLLSVIPVDYLGKNTLAFQQGVMNFISGAFLLSMPSVINVLFNLGSSYFWILILLTISAYTSGLIWSIFLVVSANKTKTSK